MQDRTPAWSGSGARLRRRKAQGSIGGARLKGASELLRIDLRTSDRRRSI